jgi:signal transduction histidine kinase
VRGVGPEAGSAYNPGLTLEAASATYAPDVVTPQIRRREALVPALIAVLAAVELAGLDMDGRLAAGVVEVAACAMLVLRRSRPLLAGTTAGVLCAIPPWFGAAIDEVATPILILAMASYSLARWVPGYRGLVGLAVVLLTLTVDYATVDVRAHNVTDAVFLLALLAPPYIFGRMMRRLADYGDLLEREQALVRREAVRDERDRIARELHDVIAHSVSSMVVQVTVAEDLVRRDPDRALDVLESAAGTGRRALAETGRLLHVIRDSADELGLAPVPGLADLPELVEGFRRRGLQVDLSDQVEATDLPAGVDVSAYRIVSEALTNAERYAAGPVELDVHADAAGVTIRAVNDSSGRSGAGSGLGLVGMAERIALLGGTMSSGTGDGGRFVLEVRLPVTVGVEEPA